MPKKHSPLPQTELAAEFIFYLGDLENYPSTLKAMNFLK